MNILITGSNGQLGREIKSIAELNSKFIFTDKEELDITIEENIRSFVKENDVKSIINCAAFTNVERAEIDKQEALKLNSKSVLNLIRICEEFDLKLIHISTDYVYNSANKKPLDENDCIDPQNFYGHSKRKGEIFVENSYSDSIIIRTSWLYSRFGNNFVKTIINKSKTNKYISIVGDQYGCPTNANDLAQLLIKLATNKERLDKNSKIYNFSNEGYTNWYFFAKTVLKEIGSDCSIKKISAKEISQTAKRPFFAITSKEKIKRDFKISIPEWKTSLIRFLNNY